MSFTNEEKEAIKSFVKAENEVPFFEFDKPFEDIFRIENMEYSDNNNRELVWCYVTRYSDSKKIRFIMPKGMQTQFENLEIAKNDLVSVKYLGKKAHPDNPTWLVHSIVCKKISIPKKTTVGSDKSVKKTTTKKL